MNRGKTGVYENENLLAAGYTADHFITWENYQRLSDIEKEMVKLDAVVLPRGDDHAGERMTEAGLTEVTKPSARISAAEPELSENGEKVTLRFHAEKGTCSFLRLKGLHGYSDYEPLYVIADGIRTHVYLRGSTNVYTIGRTDYLFNLGYNDEDAERKAVIRFSSPKGYRLDKAEILSVSMDGYEEKIAALNEESLKKEKIRDGLFEGEITVSKPKLAVFTASVQNGWDLYVDGEKTPVLTLNGMYAGTCLKPGVHQIRLVYHTPGLRSGALCTLLGLVSFLALAVSSRRRKKERDL